MFQEMIYEVGYRSKPTIGCPNKVLLLSKPPKIDRKAAISPNRQPVLDFLLFLKPVMIVYFLFVTYDQV